VTVDIKQTLINGIGGEGQRYCQTPFLASAIYLGTALSSYKLAVFNGSTLFTFILTEKIYIFKQLSMQVFVI